MTRIKVITDPTPTEARLLASIDKHPECNPGGPFALNNEAMIRYLASRGLVVRITWLFDRKKWGVAVSEFTGEGPWLADELHDALMDAVEWLDR